MKKFDFSYLESLLGEPPPASSRSAWGAQAGHNYMAAAGAKDAKAKAAAKAYAAKKPAPEPTYVPTYDPGPLRPSLADRYQDYGYRDYQTPAYSPWDQAEDSSLFTSDEEEKKDASELRNVPMVQRRTIQHAPNHVPEGESLTDWIKRSLQYREMEDGSYMSQGEIDSRRWLRDKGKAMRENWIAKTAADTTKKGIAKAEDGLEKATKATRETAEKAGVHLPKLKESDMAEYAPQFVKDYVAKKVEESRALDAAKNPPVKPIDLGDVDAPGFAKPAISSIDEKTQIVPLYAPPGQTIQMVDPDTGRTELADLPQAIRASLAGTTVDGGSKAKAPPKEPKTKTSSKPLSPEDLKRLADLMGAQMQSEHDARMSQGPAIKPENDPYNRYVHTSTEDEKTKKKPLSKAEAERERDFEKAQERYLYNDKAFQEVYGIKHDSDLQREIADYQRKRREQEESDDEAIAGTARKVAGIAGGPIGYALHGKEVVQEMFGKKGDPKSAEVSGAKKSPDQPRQLSFDQKVKRVQDERAEREVSKPKRQEPSLSAQAEAIMRGMDKSYIKGPAVKNSSIQTSSYENKEHQALLGASNQITKQEGAPSQSSLPTAPAQQTRPDASSNAMTDQRSDYIGNLMRSQRSDQAYESFDAIRARKAEQQRQAEEAKRQQRAQQQAVWDRRNAAIEAQQKAESDAFNASVQESIRRTATPVLNPQHPDYDLYLQGWTDEQIAAKRAAEAPKPVEGPAYYEDNTAYTDSLYLDSPIGSYSGPRTFLLPDKPPPVNTTQIYRSGDRDGPRPEQATIWRSNDHTSDANQKTGIQSQHNELDEMLDQLKAYSYNYKNPEAPGQSEGRKVGVMAQDLEKSEVGQQAVMETPHGKMVDYGKLAPVTLAGLVNERKSNQAQDLRLDRLEQLLGKG